MKKQKSWVNKNLIKDSFERTKTKIDNNRKLFREVDKEISENEITNEAIINAENLKDNKSKKKQIF